MKKKFIITISILILIIAGFFLIMNQKIGPGTAYHFEVIEGCDIVQKNIFVNLTTNMYDGPSIDDEILDKVILKTGFTKLKKSTLRDACKNNNESEFQTCVNQLKIDIRHFCTRR